ncbi:hypothetical protein JOF56_000845 [Kibdelosporangium banguiense]|uniref:XRE family transcriptional regulator n=1 Tax=Kibdelosporangium banguiense TaxID=1365924 RepID=A0ABS4T7S2_9PSEU|nr:hypothetical protein [Kibdelosporangium banguiense]MBP2320460.1 hypothetical protein [Kibdelosporangium banguiense]
MPTNPPARKHVAALVEKYGAGRSVRQIEADNNLKQGALSHYVNPNHEATTLRLDVLQRFEKALGAPLEEVSAAFARDYEIPLSGPQLDPDEVELLDDYRAVPPEFRACLRKMVAVARTELADTPTKDVALHRPRR